MTFDLDAFRAVHPPWSVTIGGRTFNARHVSAIALSRYERQMLAAAALVATAADVDTHSSSLRRRRGERNQLAALRQLLRVAFPWRVSFALYGDPVDGILGLPPASRTKLLRQFLAHASGANAVTLSLVAD